MRILFKYRFNHKTDKWDSTSIPVKDSTIKPTNRIQCEFHSKTDSTIKLCNRIQCEFHSKTDSTIKPSNSIQCELHSKTDLTIKPSTGFNVNSIQSQIQPLN